MSEKPVIFISHSSKDGELARLLKQQIELCFDNSVEAFAANIDPGENWFGKVMGKLNEANAIVVLITPNSVTESHWVWFELGYFWARHDDALKNSEEKHKIYYPLYEAGTDLPNPVKDLQIQAVRLDDNDLMGKFVGKLCSQFSGGNPEKFNVDVIAAKSVGTSHLNFSDKELEGLLSDYLTKEKGKNEKGSLSYQMDDLIQSGCNSDSILKRINDKERESFYKTKDNIFTGKFIIYKELDTELSLPSDTSHRLLKSVAEKFCLHPEEETDNGIRFKIGKT